MFNKKITVFNLILVLFFGCKQYDVIQVKEDSTFTFSKHYDISIINPSNLSSIKKIGIIF